MCIRFLLQNVLTVPCKDLVRIFVCLFQLIDQRYSAMRPTLVTTQYRPSDLVRRLAEQGDADTAKAIVSRLRHGARVVEFDGPDGRLA